MSMELGRVPPQNLEAEQAVLGSLLIDKDAIYRVLEHLSPGDFYRRGHQLIYQVIVLINEEGEPVDLVTVTEE
ncbi:MAG: replicative DNA helicase, partial [Clostridia bacterium]|nr:replicative DNA helicase [Clostridia bacterium]